MSNHGRAISDGVIKKIGQPESLSYPSGSVTQWGPWMARAEAAGLSCVGVYGATKGSTREREQYYCVAESAKQAMEMALEALSWLAERLEPDVRIIVSFADGVRPSRTPYYYLRRKVWAYGPDEPSAPAPVAWG